MGSRTCRVNCTLAFEIRLCSGLSHLNDVKPWPPAPGRPPLPELSSLPARSLSPSCRATAPTFHQNSSC